MNQLVGSNSSGTPFPPSSPHVSWSDTDLAAKVNMLEDLLRDLLMEISFCHMCGKESSGNERVRVFCSMCAEVMAHVRARALSGMGKELVNMLAGDDD